MRYLFAHEVNYRTKVIFEMHEFPELLASKGHEVHFLEFPERAKRDDFRAKPGQESMKGRVYSDASINLITPLTVAYGIVQRLTFFFTSFFQIPMILKKIKPDLIVTYAVPTFGLQLLIAGRILQIPVLYRAIDVSHQIRKSVFKSAIKLIEGLVIRFANFVSCNNSAMQSYVVSRGALLENTEVNYAPINIGHFRSMSSGKLGDLKELVFLGTLFEFSGLEEFIIEANTAGLFNEGYKLSIIGGGERFEALSQLVKGNSLETAVILHGFIQYRELGDFLQNPGIAINPFQKNSLTDTALPHKVIQYAAARKVIVSTSLEGLQGLFDGNETIFWVSNPSEMVSAIRRISIENKITLVGRLDRQDSVFETKLDNEKNLNSFDSLLIRYTRKK